MNSKNKKCLLCEKPLERGQKKFCSRSCSASFNNRGVRRHGKSPKKFERCLSCNKMLIKTQKKFCDNKCQALYQWTLKKEEIDQGLISSPRTLKKYVLERDGHQCSRCRKTEWMGESIPLVMDHIDGNPYNNLPENLRLICGNCDMQLPTYKSKNKGNGRHFRRKRYAENKSY